MRPKPRITKYIGLSTDTKPNADYGDTFREMDTGTVFMFDGETWHARSAEHEYSGDIVTFNARKVVPMQSVVVTMEPIQDLHGQANPYPAGGGTNLFNYEAWKSVAIERGTAVFANNGVTITATSADAYTHADIPAYPEAAKIFVTEGETITVAWEETTNDNGYIFIFPNGLVSGSAYVNNHNYKKLSYTVPSGISFVTIRFGVAVSGTTISYKNIQVVKGTTVPAWSPYSNICPISGRTGANVVVSPTTDAQDGTTYPISWQSEAGTVYGGTLDVVSGELVVDRAMVDLGSFHYTLSTERYPRFRTENEKPENIKRQADVAIPINGICEIFPVVSASETYIGIQGLSCQPNGDLRIYAPSYSDVDSFQTAMQGVMLCYELATPITYHLTPQEVRTLLGDNNVWSDAGDVTVKVKF